MQQIHEHTQNEKQHGFTLLEVVVVMLILAVLAGTVITTFNLESTNNRLDTAVQYEMTQIRDAIRKFKQDNPGFEFSDTTLCTPADASFLFYDEFDDDGDCERGENPGSPDPDEFDEWDINYNLGWRGPYLTSNGTQYVDIGDSLLHSGVNSPISGTVISDVVAIADPFLLPPVVVSEKTYFQWRTVSSDSSTNIEKHGRPYLYFDLNKNDVARIVSMGENGSYDSEGTGCEPGGDDYVLCIY